VFGYRSGSSLWSLISSYNVRGEVQRPDLIAASITGGSGLDPVAQAGVS
jgi:hypothetical protein